MKICNPLLINKTYKTGTYGAFDMSLVDECAGNNGPHRESSGSADSVQGLNNKFNIDIDINCY